MVDDPIRAVLQASLQEQARVSVFFQGAQFDGVVSRLDETTVELRQQSRRCLIRLDRIDAVVKE